MAFERPAGHTAALALLLAFTAMKSAADDSPIPLEPASEEVASESVTSADAAEPGPEAAAAPRDAAAEAAGEPAPAPPAAHEAPAGERTQEWQQQRLARTQHLEPYRPGWVERNLLAIEKAERPSIFEWNIWGFYPRFQSIASGSRNAAGVRLWKPDIGGSRWDVHGSAFYSQAHYQFYDFQFGAIPHPERSFPLRSVKGDDVYELGQVGPTFSKRMILYGSFRYRDYTQEDYFGEGPDTEREDQTTYRLRDTAYDVVVGYHLSSRLALSLRAGYLDTSLGPGQEESFPTTQERFTEATAPGLVGQPDYTHITSQLFVDFRDQPGNPRKGGMIALQHSRFDDRESEAYRFDRWAADLRGFLPLGTPSRVLALRVLATIDDKSGEARVPFYMQETLGGSHTLRGFRNFRFRGEKVLLFQAEYRWEAAPAVEFAVFGDAGRVASSGQDLSLEDLETDWGFGLRFKTFKVLLARLDWAKSNEGSRFFFRFSSSF
jgi:hypothetical protein